jgi:hypothetical protein
MMMTDTHMIANHLLSPRDVASLESLPRSYVPALHEALPHDRDLRELCCRILGWSAEQAGIVDDVMHTLRNAAARGGAVALQGDSDLVPVAFALHRRLLGADRPFVVCDPRRREGAGSVRVPPNRNTGQLALEAAAGGSICIHSNRLPKDFDALAAAFRDRQKTAVMFVCLHSNDRITRVLCNPIVIPPLIRRRAEAARLLNEYLEEAAQLFGARRLELSEQMQQCVFADASSLCELEKVALRLVALRNTPNVNQAAQRLNMAPVSLNRWVARRRWAVEFLRNPAERSRAQAG